MFAAAALLLALALPLLLPPLDIRADFDEADDGGGPPEPDADDNAVGCPVLFDDDGIEAFPMPMPIARARRSIRETSRHLIKSEKACSPMKTRNTEFAVQWHWAWKSAVIADVRTIRSVGAVIVVVVAAVTFVAVVAADDDDVVAGVLTVAEPVELVEGCVDLDMAAEAAEVPPAVVVAGWFALLASFFRSRALLLL